MTDDVEITISGVLQLRQRVYDAYTLKLINIFSEIFNRVASIYFKTSAAFSWLDVQQNTHSNKLIMLVGKVSLKSGDVFSFNGELQNITEDAEIMISIPLLTTAIETNNAQHISDQTTFIQFLSNSFEVSEITEIINSDEFIDSKSFYDNPYFEKYLNKLTKPKNVDGFDTTALTDDQIHNMFLYSDLNKMVN